MIHRAGTPSVADIRPRSTARPAPASLAWVIDALADPESRSLGDEYFVVPNAERPRFLVSGSHRRAARQAVRRSSDATRALARAGAEALALGLLFDGTRSPFRRRVRLPLGDRTDPGSLSAVLADAAGVDHPVFCVSVGTPRPQSKPVIHVLNETGDLVAHAKVGWNAVTRPLVSHERVMLELAREAAPRSFDVPPILSSGSWNGRELLVVGHAGSRPWYGSAKLRLPIDATSELSQLGARRRERLAETGYWQALRSRVTRVAEARGELADVLTDADEVIDARYGATTLELGLLHGDWAPWNMSSSRRRRVVWDWERGSELGPLGVDALYFLLQTDLWIRGREPEAAFAACRQRASSVLERIGLASQDPELLVALLGLEIAVRQEEGAVAGIPVPARIHRAMRNLPSFTGSMREATRRTGIPG